MFATAATRNTPSAHTNAYRQVGIQTGVAGASAHQLVLMLFDGFQDSVAQARGAIASGHIEAKGRAIGRAVRIVEEGLKAGLNLEAGGELAADLNALYAYITLRLTEANLHNDVAALEECGGLLEPVRSAWVAIGAQAGAKPQ
jgi:flagellar secretion chaperone FliS